MLQDELKTLNKKLDNQGFDLLNTRLFSESLSLIGSCIDSLEDLNSQELDFFKNEFTCLVNDYKYLLSLKYKHNLKKLKKGVK